MSALSNGPVAGRSWTLSIAVPGSVIDNTQNAEFATYVAGQIARAAAIFNVDEVVVIDEEPAEDGTVSAGAAFLARILQYQETPQYLRKALVPFHRDLRLAGLLPPVDAPHHMRAMEWRSYREGIVTSSDASTGSLVDVGLYETQAHVAEALQPGVRVTLAMGDSPQPEPAPDGSGEVLPARVVPPSEPREAGGIYWGYTTRLASGLQAAIDESPFEGGYDLTVGTSERGEAAEAPKLTLPPFRHALIAFGGPRGLEDCAAKDPALGQSNDAPQLFQRWLNTCPHQGSRTIRTEEAVLVSLGFLQSAIRAAASKS